MLGLIIALIIVELIAEGARSTPTRDHGPIQALRPTDSRIGGG
jgi:hypothetical protein